MADESSFDSGSWNWRREGRKRKTEADDDVEIVMIEKKVREGPQVNSNDTKFHEKFENDDDLDYAIALSLQETENKEAKRPGYTAHNVTGPSLLSTYDPRSIVDERWELEDPHPNIHELFVQFDAMFFEQRLINAGVAVSWGPRMTLCAGLCSYQNRAGFCSIRLSEPLLKLRPRRNLVETLLHEMIHALLFVTSNNRDRDSHGPEFRSHMERINKMSGTKITVYHSFHDEVNLYRQHWWKCNGPCQNRKPFFGMVRRSINRAPSKNDHWWAEHQATCGGSFVKIKEPENYSANKKKYSKKEHVKSRDLKTMLDSTNSKSHTHTTENETRFGTGMEVIDLVPEDDSVREKREKMLQAAEKRLLKSANNSSRDIRKFMTTPSSKTTNNSILSNQQSTSTGILKTESTPISKAESTPISKSQASGSGLICRADNRLCPVCGRNDIPAATLNAHISFCLEEMELSGSDDNE